MRLPKVLTVWFMLLQAISAGDIDAMADTLSEDEEYQSEMIQIPDLRDRYIASHALARSVIADVNGCDLSDIGYLTDDHGKPSFQLASGRPSAGVSLSRTEGLVAFAHGDGLDVGVDVEIMRPEHADRTLAAHLFSAPEQELLAKLAGREFEDAFFRIWTLKEAYVKAKGKGLSLPLDDFAFAPDDAKIQFLNALKGTEDQWSFRCAPVSDRHMMSVAAKTDGNPIVVVYRQIDPAMLVPQSFLDQRKVRRRA